jgi:hypothetical protein
VIALPASVAPARELQILEALRAGVVGKPVDRKVGPTGR